MTDDNNAANQPATAAADSAETTGGPANDETTIVPPVPVAAQELAWSVDTEVIEPDNQSWASVWGRATVMVAIAGAVAVVIGILGWMVVHQDSRATPLPAASTMPAAALPPISTEPPTPSVPRPDGAYQITYWRAAVAATTWWAFRSSCTPAGLCTASGVSLDDTDHSVRNANNVTDTLKYTDGQWVGTPGLVPNTNGPPGCPKDSTQWTWRPQHNGTSTTFTGTFTGIQTDTIEGSCGSAGNTTLKPFTATRIGPVPAGVFAD
jgi:serine/threonine protein kinase, bacterial